MKFLQKSSTFYLYLSTFMDLIFMTSMSLLMDIMWPTSESHFHLSFIFIEMNFYSLSFLCNVCNEVYEHI